MPPFQQYILKGYKDFRIFAKIFKNKKPKLEETEK
jgi:hypothetical protein